MTEGITNHKIVIFFNKEKNGDTKKYFIGVFPSNFVLLTFILLWKKTTI